MDTLTHLFTVLSVFCNVHTVKYEQRSTLRRRQMAGISALVMLCRVFQFDVLTCFHAI
jgi:hypothetical protein